MRQKSQSQPPKPRPRPPQKGRPAGGAVRRATAPIRAWSLTIGPGSIAGVAIAFAILLGWGLGMTALLLFGDRLSTRLIAQNSELQEGYEQRLSLMRQELTRLENEAMELAAQINQAAQTPLPDLEPQEPAPLGQPGQPARLDPRLEQRIGELMQRQNRIEARQNMLLRVHTLLGAAAPGEVAPGSAPASAPGGAPVPLPAPRPREGPGQAATDGRVIRQNFTPPPPAEPSRPLRVDLQRLPGAMRDMDRTLIGMDENHIRMIDSLALLAGKRVETVKEALDEVEFDYDPILAPPRPGRATAPPAIPLSVLDIRSAYGPRLQQINAHVDAFTRLRPVIEALPFARPMARDTRLTSRFGPRMHPIHREPRMHAGLDFGAPTGAPVLAGGSGVVSFAGVAGGYGNMIQIDHGHGVSTRHAHLSSMEVSVGQPVSRGMLIGRVGSTGASTGPHLHYETRIEGAAIDPLRFILSGETILPQTGRP